VSAQGVLCMYILRQWSRLANEALADALCDGKVIREFAGTELDLEKVLDVTTLLSFRRLLEQHDLNAAILAEVNEHLAERGLLMRQGDAIHAAITAAPNSTKSELGKRDLAINPKPKSNQRYIRTKMRSGVDAESGLIQSVVCTAANGANTAHGHELLYGLESTVHGNSGYTTLAQRDAGRLRPEIGSFTAMKRGRLKSMLEGTAKAVQE
jgi:transposase, IS5 family